MLLSSICPYLPDRMIRANMSFYTHSRMPVRLTNLSLLTGIVGRGDAKTNTKLHACARASPFPSFSFVWFKRSVPTMNAAVSTKFKHPCLLSSTETLIVMSHVSKIRNHTKCIRNYTNISIIPLILRLHRSHIVSCDLKFLLLVLLS